MCFLLKKEWIGERSRTECFHLLVAVATVNLVVVGSVGVAVDDVDAAELAGADLSAAAARESIVDVVARSGGIGVVDVVATVNLVVVDDIGIVVDSADAADTVAGVAAAVDPLINVAENIAVDYIVVVVVVAKLAADRRLFVVLVR